MKKTAIFGFFMAIGLLSFGQTSDVGGYVEKLDQVNLEKIYPLLVNYNVMMMEYPRTYKLNADSLYPLANRDPIGLFPELKNQYNTELKMKRFLSSDDYKLLLDKMDSISASIKEKGIMFSVYSELLSNYDLDKKRFTLLVGQSFPKQQAMGGPVHTETTTADIIWGYFKLPAKVKTISIPFAPAAKEIVQFALPIPCESEDIAAKIEDGISSGTITIFVTVKPELVVKQVNYSYYKDTSSMISLITPTTKSRDLKKMTAPFIYFDCASITLNFLDDNTKEIIYSLPPF